MERRQAHVNEDTDRRLDLLAKHRDINSAEAVRISINEGLRELGYGTVDVTPDSRLRASLREVARILGYGGGMLLAVATLLPLTGTPTLPVGVELSGVVIAGAGLIALAIERVLEATGATPVQDLTNTQSRTPAVTDGGGDDS